MLNAIGPIIRRELEDDNPGHANVTVTNIIEHVVQRYGALDSNNVKSLLAQLVSAFSSIDTFLSDCQRMRICACMYTSLSYDFDFIRPWEA